MPSKLASWLSIPLILLVFCLAEILAPAARGSESFRARPGGKDTVSEGEPFLLQLHVEGHEGAAPAEIDTSAIRDFAVESLGGRATTALPSPIINGQMKRVESRDTSNRSGSPPSGSGQLTIPPLIVPVDGRKMSTEAISIRVNAAGENRRCSAGAEIFQDRIYVGER